MRISTFTDFGLRTLVHLAQLPDGQLSSVQEVAKVYNISKNHLVKVTGQLQKGGYIHTFRGQNGGITLAQPADQIRIGEVIAHLENHLDGIDCNSPACHLSGNCRLQGALKEGVSAFISSMNQYTLQQMLLPANSDERPVKLSIS